jgi:alpha-L-fucosidase 2
MTLSAIKIKLGLSFSLLTLWACSAQSTLATATSALPPGNPDRYDVIWDTPSKSAIDSMPIGNGDIGLNVWVEQSGDLLFYIAKTDACSENSEFLKLGRVRVHLMPNVFSGPQFRQTLRLGSGDIVITAGQGDAAQTLEVWVDANRPEIHVNASSGKPFVLQASLELWRTKPRTIDSAGSGMGQENFGLYESRGGPPIVIDPDTVLPAEANRLIWFHRNERSIYPDVLRVQHLESLLDKYPDPLLHRTFGCVMRGPGLIAADDHTLHSAKPLASQRLDITAYTAQTDTAAEWKKSIQQLADSDDATDVTADRKATADWWVAFWDRSWIDVTGSQQAEQVASGYALQRWMEACDGRGALPIKYNGGMFTVGRSFSDPTDKNKKIDDPDWRAWGSNIWFQNTRHLYWPLIVSGDDDLLAPWFKMYVDDLPLVTDKTRLYYHHGGACFQETIFFWGLANNSNFGWHNKNVETENTWIRWYWSGGIEMTAMMLARYQYTNDREFAIHTLLPFAEAITTFYDEHWKRDNSGMIRFAPAQSLETWQSGVVNPLPEIAGLRYVLPQLMALPKDLISPGNRETWNRLLADLPPIPIGPGNDGEPVLLPAQKFTRPANSENTELYAVYPYRLYGVGLRDLELAQRTYAQRRFVGPTCWSQDPMDAALLGITSDAQAYVVANFTCTGARFQAFWKPGHDWIPDFDNGGAGMQTLQWMLMQCDGERIQLLPAWPSDWNADFKLRAPNQTTVQASVRDGKIVFLKVTPESRRADVVLSSSN